MNKVIFHIDFNSYFATVEQQANPRLRGKAIGVTGGDRLTRTVLGAVSIEAKARGVRGGMTLAEARKFCPDIILVKGDSDKYLECTKRFLNIFKDYSPTVEVFSIDEVFMEVALRVKGKREGEGVISKGSSRHPERSNEGSQDLSLEISPYSLEMTEKKDLDFELLRLGTEIKQRISKEVGDWITCSIGISYNKFMAKLAGSLQKPDGLVGIFDEQAAMMILDHVELDKVCGIGSRIKARLNNIGIFSFSGLRKVPLDNLIASFKNHQGQVLYKMARGIDDSLVNPFYEKEEVKSVGHRLTLDQDTADPLEIKQVLLKLSELVARRLRAKKLVGKTVSIWYRAAFSLQYYNETGHKFYGDGMQCTINYGADGLEIFKAGWELFLGLWDKEAIRMIGVSVSNLKPKNPENLTFLDDVLRQERITSTLDKINDRYGEFTLQRAVLLGAHRVKRMANPFLSDRRFKL